MHIHHGCFTLLIREYIYKYLRAILSRVPPQVMRDWVIDASHGYFLLARGLKPFEII